MVAAVQPLLRARSWLLRSPAQPAPGAEASGRRREGGDGCCPCSRRLSPAWHCSGLSAALTGSPIPGSALAPALWRGIQGNTMVGHRGSALSLQPQGLPSPPEEAALCQHWVPALSALPVAVPCQAGAAVCSEPCEHTHTHTRCPAAPGLLAEVTWVPEPGQAQRCLLPRTLLPTWGTPRGSRGKSHSQVFTARPHSGPLVSSLLPPSPPPAAPRTEIVPG